VLELHRAGDFGEDREGVRIPLEHDFTHGHRIALVLLEARAVDGGVAFALAAVVVHDRDHAVAVHDHQAAILAAHGRQVDELDEALALGLLPRLLADAAGGAADVEGAHGQLGAGLADGLGGDDADRLAHLDQLAAGQVAPVAGDADTALGLAGEHAADEHALDAGALDAVGQILGDFLVHVHDGVAFVVADALERNAADDAVAQAFDGLAGVNDGADVDAVHRAAVVFADDDVLRHVHQAAGEVAGVGGLERGVGEPLARAVGRDEILQHRQSLAEIGGDRGLDDLARGLGHQAAHAGELADLLLRSAGAGVGHDVHRVDRALAVLLFEHVEHHVGDLLGDVRPDFHNLVVALAVGDGAIQV